MHTRYIYSLVDMLQTEGYVALGYNSEISENFLVFWWEHNTKPKYYVYVCRFIHMIVGCIYYDRLLSGITIQVCLSGCTLH